MSFIGLALNIWRDVGGTGGGGAWVLAPGGVVATLDIDFVNNRAWNSPSFVSISSLLTCTRATPALATYTNAAGVIQYFAPNTLRYGNNGLLVEEARTNILLFSQDLDNASWDTNGGSVTITANVTVAPDGTTTGDMMTAVAASDALLVRNSIGSGTVSSTCYIKPGTTTWFAMSNTAAFAYFNCSGAGALGTITEGIASIVALANGWYKCEWNGQTSSGAIRLRIVNGNSSVVVTPGVNLYLWGAQLEVGAFATSYIPTAATSVTREADVVIVNAGPLAAIQGAAGTILLSTNIIQSPHASTRGLFGRSDGTDQRFLYQSSISTLNSFNGTTILQDGAVAFQTIAVKSAVAFNGAGKSLVANASTVATDVSVIGTITNAQVGGIPVSGILFINGFVSRLAFWNSKLSDANLSLVTA